MTSLADTVDAYDNVVTLREAITVYANDGDTITFAPELKGGTITLGGSQIEIAKSITVDASALWDATQDTPGITIDANSQSRIFSISGDTVIESLAFTRGFSDDGGAIYIALYSTATILNSQFYNNSAVSSGGAIMVYKHATSTISNSTFQNNTASYDGGAVDAAYGSTATISNSHFDNNSASEIGGAISAGRSTVTISNSTFQNNTADYGSAIFLFCSTLKISTNSTFQNNNTSPTPSYTGGWSSYYSNYYYNGAISGFDDPWNDGPGNDSEVTFFTGDIDNAAPRPLGGVYIVHHAFNATATLTWAPFAGATSYAVYKATNGGPFMPAGSGLSETTCDVGVSVGVTYTIKVEALGNDGKVLARTTTSFTPIHTGAPLFRPRRSVCRFL